MKYSYIMVLSVFLVSAITVNSANIGARKKELREFLQKLEEKLEALKEMEEENKHLKEDMSSKGDNHDNAPSNYELGKNPHDETQLVVDIIESDLMNNDGDIDNAFHYPNIRDNIKSHDKLHNRNASSNGNSNDEDDEDDLDDENEDAVLQDLLNEEGEVEVRMRGLLSKIKQKFQCATEGDRCGLLTLKKCCKGLKCSSIGHGQCMTDCVPSGGLCTFNWYCCDGLKCSKKNWFKYVCE